MSNTNTSSASTNRVRSRTVVLVPTFRATNDAASPPKNAPSRRNRSDDPFLYFSDQDRRMAFLAQEDAVDEERLTKRSRRATEPRKRRISFELHASTVMGELMAEATELDLDVPIYDEDEDDDYFLQLFLPHLSC